MNSQEKRLQDIASDLLKDLLGEAQTTVSRSEKQISGFMSRLAEHGSVSQEEAKRVASETIKRLRKNRHEVTGFIDKRLEKMARVLTIPSRSEVEELKKQVAKLSKRIDRLSQEIA